MMSRLNPDRPLPPVDSDADRDDTYVTSALDALEDGDRPFRTGTARAALRHPTFRRVFIGAFLSNIGTWMQNVVLGALAYDLTESPSFVGVLLFAQLGPLLLFSLTGGLLADLVDRRRLLIGVSVTQGLLSLVLAWVCRGDDPTRAAIVAVVFLIGVGQAIFAPTYSALLPALVARRDLPGAISLNSAQMNGSRVIGPLIGAALYARFGASWVFVGNAASYVLVIGSLATVRLPDPAPDPNGQTGLRRLGAGLATARADRVVGRCLLLIFLFSLLSLPFIGQMPTIAERNLGIAARSGEYGILYACFGIGALAGALSIGTVLSDRNLVKVTRYGFVMFAAFLAAFAAVRSAAAAYVTVLLVGVAYFAVVTSLSTVLQQRLDDSTRGRVIALWIMAFGGTIPIGNLLAGPLIEATSITTVVLIGAAVAVALSWYADLTAPVIVQAATSG
jgi:MFS family permease